MAKKKVTKEGELPDVFEMMKGIDDNIEIIEESSYSNINEWISTGNYLLNAAISGSLFGGIPSGRVTTLAGVPGSGKSFLACNICREAQNEGYNILYLDSEGAMDKSFMRRIGVDTSKVMIKQVNTVTEVSEILANTCKNLDDMRAKYGSAHKFLIVLDSLGNLTSTKELTDTLENAGDKRDMTRAQNIKALFRVNATPMARNGIIFVVISHIYQTIGAYVPTSVVSGGSGINYNSSVTLMLSPSKLQDKAAVDATEKAANKDDVLKSGVLVTAKVEKSRFTIPRKVRFSISYHAPSNKFIGLESYINWETSHICRGSILSESEWKKAGGDSDTIHSWEFNGQTLHCQEKETARNLVIGHLGKTVPLTGLWTPEVFTDEFLHELDEKVIKPAFELPDQASFDIIDELEDLVELGDDVEDNNQEQ